MVNDMSEKADVVFAELTFRWVQSVTSCFDPLEGNSESDVMLLLVTTTDEDIDHVTIRAVLSG